MPSETTPTEEERIQTAAEEAVEEAGEDGDLLAAVETAADKHGVRYRMGDVYDRARKERGFA